MMTFIFSFTKPVNGKTEHYFPCLGQTGWNYALDPITRDARVPSVRSYNSYAGGPVYRAAFDEAAEEGKLADFIKTPKVIPKTWFDPADAWKTFASIREAMAQRRFGKQPQLEHIAENLVDECDQVLALLEKAIEVSAGFELALEETEDYPPVLDTYVYADWGNVPDWLAEVCLEFIEKYEKDQAD